MANWPTLQRDDGYNLYTLQYLLSVWKTGLPVDGQFGAQTEAAVADFQHLKGLDATGIVEEPVWQALTDGSAPINSTVRKGSTGQQVRAVQTELNKVGKVVGVDGRFGDATDKAVREVQADTGETVDGIVGPNTWLELITRSEVS
jgi:peptidoglycan hydrolase-like protein with peptidoglycan-binding domain